MLVPRALEEFELFNERMKENSDKVMTMMKRKRSPLGNGMGNLRGFLELLRMSLLLCCCGSCVARLRGKERWQLNPFQALGHIVFQARY